MTDKFYPILGDIAIIIQRVKEGKYLLGYMENFIKEDPNFDIYLAQYGEQILYHLSSFQAHEEFSKLVQVKIDRQENCDDTIKKLGFGAFSLQKSSERQRERRHQLTKLIGFNNLSRLIPLMIRLSDKVLSQLKKTKSLNLTHILRT